MKCIWWEQISKAKRFLSEIEENLLTGKSVLLLEPEKIPWKDVMYESIEEVLHAENPEYRLEQFDCPEQEAGYYLMEHYCKQKKRASYRPGRTIASFLAESEDVVLNQRYLWVKNVPQEHLKDWIEFITEYNKCVPAHSSHAAFLLEVMGPQFKHKGEKGIVRLGFSETIKEYDRFAFCAVASADTAVEEELHPYLAELAAMIGGQDLELCDACIRHGKALLENPAGVLHKIQEEESRSDGLPYEIQPCLAQLDPLIWEAQIKLLFPAIQKYLSRFIRKHFEQLADALPIMDAFDQVIDTPHALEAGQLLRLAACQKVSTSSAEHAHLKLCRDARNDLAHLSPVTFDVAKQILLL